MLKIALIFFQICNAVGFEYLAFHFWIGVWLAVIATLAVAVETSVLVRFLTRFVQDIFAIFISLIYITKSVKAVYKVRLEYC